jgi:hypothetical protein
MAMLPPDRVVMLTSEKIQERGKLVTTAREVPKNIGIFPAVATFGSSPRNTLFDSQPFGREN